jgi:hypothetical protein
MLEKETIERAREDEAEGKAPSTQAGEFVREEIHHVREGRHGARSTKQAIAIGLSKARRAGVKLKPPKKGKAKTRQSAARAYRAGQAERKRKPSATRARGSWRPEARRPPRGDEKVACSSGALVGAHAVRGLALGRGAKGRAHSRSPPFDEEEVVALERARGIGSTVSRSASESLRRNLRRCAIRPHPHRS